MVSITYYVLVVQYFVPMATLRQPLKEKEPKKNLISLNWEKLP